MFNYNLEDTDIVDESKVFNGQDSVLWNNIRDAFQSDLRAMYQSLRSSGALSYAKVEKMFEDHQNKWPENIFNEDAQAKYLAPLEEENDATYLPMLQGSKEEQRKWWLYNRFRYIDSKYNAGDSQSDYIIIRCYSEGNFTITPYTDIYVALQCGSYFARARATHGVPTPLHLQLDALNDTETHIFSASQLSDVGDLAPFNVGLANFSAATRLTRLKLGDADPNYRNTQLKSISLGNNRMLAVLDLRNCVNMGIEQGEIDFSGCTNIEEAYFDGTKLKSVVPPNGGKLRVLHLPETTNNLSIMNQPRLADLTISGNPQFESLRLENVGSGVDMKAMLDKCVTGARVRLVGFDWTVADPAALYEQLSAFVGADSDGVTELTHAYMDGTIHVGAIDGDVYTAIRTDYPYIIIDYTSLTLTVRYYDDNTTTLLHSENVNIGENATWATQPTKAEDADNVYAFAGWATKAGGAVDANAQVNIQKNRNLYAVYNATPKPKVFYHSDNTQDSELFYTESVAPGGNATYTGTPTKEETDRTTYTFKAWSPDYGENQGAIGDTLKNLTADVHVYPIWDVETVTYLYYYSDDTTTLLKTETILNGGNGKEAPTPTKAQTAQYTYTFAGWTKTSGGTTVDSAALNAVTADRNVYAVFTATVRSYTVTFKNTDGTTLETKSVNYGSTPTYTGATPVDPSGNAMPFEGWSPALGPITGNTTYTAAYENPVEVVDRTADASAFLAALETGTVQNDFKVGNYFTLDLGSTYGTALNAQIVGFGTKNMPNGTAAQVDIIFKELLLTKHVMNTTSTSEGGWAASNMRSWLAETGSGSVWAAIPAAWRSHIVPVVNYSYIYNGSANGESTDKLWIPSYRELTGNSRRETVGPAYTSIFKNDNSRIKTLNGSAALYWERSAGGASSFRCVPSGGSADGGDGANVSGGVALGFSLGSTLEASLIQDDWATIIANVNNGTYATKYNVGDLVSLNLGAEGTNYAQIVAFNEGSSHISFVTKDLLKTNHRMNPSRAGESGNYTIGTGAIGGWEHCEMRSYLNTTIKPLMPEVLRNALVTVSKTQPSYNSAGTQESQTTQDDLWIPSYDEMTNTYSAVFTDNNARRKHKVGSTDYKSYWERSANGAGDFRCVNSGGSADYDGGAGNSNGVALGFQI